MKMKNNYSLLVAALITGLWASPVSAMEQYVSGNIGMSWVNDINDGAFKYSLDGGTNVLGAIGIRCPDRDCRLEAEVGYQTNSINTLFSRFGSSDYRGDVNVWSFLANGYYNIYDGKGFKPYLTAGLGAARIKFDDLRFAGDHNRYSEHETALAYQVGVGAAVPLSPGVKLDARYRHFATADFRLDDGFDTHFASNSLLLGLRIKL
ncbi:MAG: porin family protein [Chlorobium sp.]|jgi:opacity protein-like surface antigen|nr:MAG: porin family protein [Chlorobium sp.]